MLSKYFSNILIVFFSIFILLSCSQSGDKKIGSSMHSSASGISAIALPFGHDYYAGGINLYDDERDMIKRLGVPTEKNIQKCDHIAYCGVYIYPFGKFELEGDKEGYLYVVSITLTASGIFGPRQTQVGDDMESVIYKFPHEKHSIQNKKRKLYGDEEKLYDKTYSKVRDEELGYGVINYDQEGNIVEIIYSDGRVGFMSHWLIYKVTNGKVSEINIYVGTV
ncbi:MAG: hypothetical protein AB1306_03615 [Nitrospirota bacterium]